MAQFFTDFSEYTTGVQPSDWTNRWAASTWTVEADAGATGGKVLRVVAGSAARRLLTWDDVGTPGTVEVLIKARTNAFNTLASHFAAVARSSGNGTTTTGGYAATVRTPAGVDEVALDEWVSGSGNFRFATAAFDWSTDTWFWIRFQLSSSNLKARIWEDGSAEPGTWNIETTDASHSSGWVGAFCGVAATVDFDVFGVGTDGDPAPDQAAAATNITIGPVVIEYTLPALTLDYPTARSIGPVAYAYSLPALMVSMGVTQSIGPVAEEYTVNGMEPEREVSLGPVAHEYTMPALAITGLGPAATLGPVVEEYTLPALDFDQPISIGPVVVEYSFPAFGFTNEGWRIGPVVIEYALPAFVVDQDVVRTLGPVLVEYTVITPVNDAKYARDLGPVLVEYTVNPFNIRVTPVVVRVTPRGPTWFIHSHAWPRVQLAVLTTAGEGDRSFVGMSVAQQARQASQASVGIAVSDALFSSVSAASIVRHGNLLVCESPGMPVWAGPILTVEEDDGSGSIELSALGMEALLDGRVTPQNEEYRQATGEARVFRSLVDGANARNQTGILMALSVATGRSVEELAVGGTSVMEALNEVTSRTGSEWWLEITRNPRKLDATLKLGRRQGIDLSGTLHLYQGVHFTGSYKADMSQVRQSVTAIGGFGEEMSEREAVTVYADAPGVDFGRSLRQGEGTRRAVRSLPAALRTEKVLVDVMPASLADLASEAQRAHERPLGAGEMFSDVMNTLVDWNKLRVGNYWTRHGSHQGSTQVRVVRIVALQPDESSGTVAVVSEVKV